MILGSLNPVVTTQRDNRRFISPVYQSVQLPKTTRNANSQGVTVTGNSKGRKVVKTKKVELDFEPIVQPKKRQSKNFRITSKRRNQTLEPQISEPPSSEAVEI